MHSDELKHFIRLAALTVVCFTIASATLTKVIYIALGERPIEAIESPVMIAKEEAARANPRVNHLFVGSSATWRQIDPLTFDSSVGEGINSYSFNLGNDGLYPMRSVSYLEHLIDTLPDRIEVVFFELYALDGLSFNYNSPELMRITNLGNFVDVAETLVKANFPKQAKLQLLFEYLRSFLSKSIGFGLLSYQQFERDLPPMHAERLSRSPRGFYPKDVEITETQFPDNRAKLIEVGSVMQDHPELLQQRRAAHAAKYARAWNLDPNPFADKLQELFDRARARGIRLIFFVPPLLTPAGISFAYPAFLLMPEGSRLDLSDPERFPEIYEADNVFDIEHVNSRGAAFLSRYFAEEYARLVRKGYQSGKPVEPSD